MFADIVANSLQHLLGPLAIQIGNLLRPCRRDEWQETGNNCRPKGKNPDD
jgi:hypothetical protein